MKRPNVLLIYTDQQRWDTIRAGGNALMHTPNLDRLVDRGVLFDHAYVNSPVCMPSRASMLSGLYPSVTGVPCNGVEMPAHVPVVPQFLKSYGYRTANIGKLHFKNHASAYRDHSLPHPSFGFDVAIISDEPGCYDDPYIKWVEEHDPDQVELCRIDTPPAWRGRKVEVHPRDTDQPYPFGGREELTQAAFVADETCRFITENADQPFFCIAGIYAPHAPLNPPERFLEFYDTEKLPSPVMNEGENRRGHSKAHWKKVKAYYYALISHVDDQVGRMLDALEAAGVADDTIVIFTSDHGEHLGDHGLVGKSRSYDSSSRVPLIISYPKGKIQKTGQRREEIVEAVDLVPTILDWCGIPIPTFLQGRSIRPLLEGRDYEPRQSAFMELGHPSQRNFKAIRTHEALYQIDSQGEELLFDMAKDPHQLHNVAADPQYANLLGRMRRVLIERWFDVQRQDPQRTGDY